jgi:hypothetical protein
MQGEILDTLLNIKEISVFAVLSAVIWFLIIDRNNLRDTIKDKDSKIMKVIESHQSDLKESNKDLQSMSEKWAVVFAQLKDIIRDKK